MEKRAQVTTFIIIGILLIAVVGIFFYARSYGLGISPGIFVANKKDAIQSRIDECAVQQATRVIDILGRQGGTLTPLRFRQFNGNNINYLCYNIPGKDECVNRILTLGNMEQHISDFVENNLRNCVNLADFRSGGISIDPGNIEVSTTIGQDNVLVIVDYPITLQKEAVRLTITRTTSTIKIPLGRLYLTAIDIIDSEARVGEFDQLPYMLVHNLVRIEKHRPYPDKVYVMNVRGSNYIFQFAVEGEA